MRATGGLGFEAMAIATLIAAGRLDDRLVDRALGLLREVDPKAVFRHWIDEGDAADLRFSGDVKTARWALPRRARGRGLSCSPGRRAALEAAVRRRHGIPRSSGEECIDELADYAGLKDKVARITERAMQGELDFPGALRERGGCSPASTSASSAAVSTSACT